MKQSVFLTVLTSLVLATGNQMPAESKEVITQCNLRYNSPTIHVAGAYCRAWFSGNKRLVRVKFLYPPQKKWYDWSTSQPGISKDSRWRECIRHTDQKGNQWQVCTVPSPEELKL